MDIKNLKYQNNFFFNQYLVRDDEPLLFHTGLRKMFPLVKEAVASVMLVEKIRYVASRMWKQMSVAP